ncbi:MAG: hypothetical protein ACRDP1_03430 [Nocardioidaceae bacterium]
MELGRRDGVAPGKQLRGGEREQLLDLGDRRTVGYGVVADVPRFVTEAVTGLSTAKAIPGSAVLRSAASAQTVAASMPCSAVIRWLGTS